MDRRSRRSRRLQVASCALVTGLALLTPALFGEPGARPAEPLVIGDTFTLDSEVLGETRRVNVYRPAAWGLADDAPLPVLYMPDGGTGEDFLHIAGLVQIGALNGTMRPFLLVGIENTERRRDLTGPTEVDKDREITARVGGSAAFRRFLRTELMPLVRARYPTTDESAIVGESLAGLFVVETFLLEPDLFDGYVAVDPSLWWNGGALVEKAAALVEKAAALVEKAAALVEGAAERVVKHPVGRRTLFLAHSDQEEIGALTARLAEALGAPELASKIEIHHLALPEETHATVFHPAALRAFRTVFAPEPPTP